MSSVLHLKYPILMKLEFSRNFRKNQISNFMKIRKWEQSSMRTEADGRTDGWIDMTKLLAAFRNFANTRKTLPTLIG